MLPPLPIVPVEPGAVPSWPAEGLQKVTLPRRASSKESDAITW